MFKFFKKKSQIEVLEAKYKSLLEESFKLSKTNRAESDKKYAEADEIMKLIQELSKDIL